MCDCKGYPQNRVLDATDGILGAFLNQESRPQPPKKEIIPEGDHPVKPRDSWKTRTDTGHRASMNRKSA